MAFDIEMIKKVYDNMASRVDARKVVGHPMTLRKFYTVTYGMRRKQAYGRGVDYVDLCSRQSSLSRCNSLKWFCCNFMHGKKTVAVPITVHCDHL
jgi:aconitate hydratase